jgi:hypothetical protein
MEAVNGDAHENQEEWHPHFAGISGIAGKVVIFPSNIKQCLPAQT